MICLLFYICLKTGGVLGFFRGWYQQYYEEIGQNLVVINCLLHVADKYSVQEPQPYITLNLYNFMPLWGRVDSYSQRPRQQDATILSKYVNVKVLLKLSKETFHYNGDMYVSLCHICKLYHITLHDIKRNSILKNRAPPNGTLFMLFAHIPFWPWAIIPS
jgi:hypothetical protein